MSNYTIKVNQQQIEALHAALRFYSDTFPDNLRDEDVGAEAELVAELARMVEHIEPDDTGE